MVDGGGHANLRQCNKAMSGTNSLFWNVTRWP